MNKKKSIIAVFVVGLGIMIAGCGAKTDSVNEANGTPLEISGESTLPAEDGNSSDQRIVVENTQDGCIRVVLNDAAVAGLYAPDDEKIGTYASVDVIAQIHFYRSDSLDDMTYDPIEFHKTGMAVINILPYTAELAAYVNTGDGSYTDTESFDRFAWPREKRFVREDDSLVMIFEDAAGFLDPARTFEYESCASGSWVNVANANIRVEASTAVVVSNDNTVNVYQIGNDTLAVAVRGEAANGIDDGGLQLEINCDDGRSISVHISDFPELFYIENGESHHIEGINNDDMYLLKGKDLCYIEIRKPGLISELPAVSGKYELKQGYENFVCNGKTSDIWTESDEMKLAGLRAEGFMSLIPEHKAGDEWSGEYYAKPYYGGPALLEVEVSDTGMLHFSLRINGDTEDYYGEADDRNIWCDVPRHYGKDWESSYSFIRTGEEGGVEVRDHVHQKEIYFVRLEDTNYHEAPTGYIDRDPFGEHSVTYGGESEYFVPATDDYMITYYDFGKPAENFSTGEGYVNCERYAVLTSFDRNGYEVQEVVRYVFADEKEARSAYEIRIRNKDSADYYLNDKVIYAVESFFMYRMAKSTAMVRYDWYTDCHFMSETGYYSGENKKNYAYVSCPVASSDFALGKEDILYFNDLADELTSSDGNLTIRIDEERYDIKLDHHEYKTMRFYGRTAVGASIEDGNLYIAEFDFGDDVIKIKEYGYGSKDVSLDDYKNAKAQSEKEYSFTFKYEEGK